jgi:hypothetical protein
MEYVIEILNKEIKKLESTANEKGMFGRDKKVVVRDLQKVTQLKTAVKWIKQRETKRALKVGE